MTIQVDNILIKMISLFLLFIFLISCSDTIVSGNTLDSEDLNYIQELGLLDKNEKVELFYYTISPKTTGNFITNKRIASYLQYDNNPNRHKDFAYYYQIDTLYADFRNEFGVGNRIFIKKKDGSEFIVNVNGDKKIMDDFFNKARQHWEASKKDTINITRK